MQTLNLPAYPFKISQKEGKTFIFDTFRHSWVFLTPEEWVRQHFLKWLVTDHAYPAGLIAVETSLKYNNLKMRADAVIYNKNTKPLVLVECKAPHVTINQQTFEQAARYNFSFKTRYLLLTNGLLHYCCEINTETGNIHFLENIPAFKDIAS
ncbi:MAG: type I restriction enzyme HsdR N-terminal domain-containing protein [Bacteroidota bacterium]